MNKSKKMCSSVNNWISLFLCHPVKLERILQIIVGRRCSIFIWPVHKNALVSDWMGKWNSISDIKTRIYLKKLQRKFKDLKMFIGVHYVYTHFHIPFEIKFQRQFFRNLSFQFTPCFHVAYKIKIRRISTTTISPCALWKENSDVLKVRTGSFFPNPPDSLKLSNGCQFNFCQDTWEFKIRWEGKPRGRNIKGI